MSRVADISYHITGMMGCCGASVLSRVRGRRVSDDTAASHRETWKNTEDAVLALVDRRQWKVTTMKANMRRLRYMPLVPADTRLGVQAQRNGRTWYGACPTLEMAFGSILEDMKDHCRSLWFMSDNMSEEGDVHLGPCSTREFVKWLMMEQLGAIHTSGPIGSRSTRANIQGWIFCPNKEAVSRKVTAIKADYIQFIEEINSASKNKGTTETRCQADSIARQALDSLFRSGWLGS